MLNEKKFRDMKILSESLEMSINQMANERLEKAAEAFRMERNYADLRE